MARIRSLKPDCWADEAFEGLSRDARLLFVGLVTQADDEGRQKGHPALLKSLVFPYDVDLAPAEVGAWLDELTAAGLAVAYDVGGRSYLYLPGWKTNQRIDRPQASKLPPPPGQGDEAGADPDVGAAPLFREGDAPKPKAAPKRKPRPNADVLPEDYPTDLAPFVEPVRALIAEVAEKSGATGAILPTPASIGRAIADNPGRDFLVEARTYRAWALERARTPHKDPTRGYRNWLARAPKVAQPERPGDADVTAGRPRVGIVDSTADRLAKAGLS